MVNEQLEKDDEGPFRSYRSHLTGVVLNNNLHENIWYKTKLHLTICWMHLTDWPRFILSIMRLLSLKADIWYLSETTPNDGWKLKNYQNFFWMHEKAIGYWHEICISLGELGKKDIFCSFLTSSLSFWQSSCFPHTKILFMSFGLDYGWWSMATDHSFTDYIFM